MFKFISIIFTALISTYISADEFKTAAESKPFAKAVTKKVTENDLHQKWAEWSRPHSYFDPADHKVYQAYDLQKLAALAKQNDLLATQVLAQKLVIAKEFTKALPIYSHAIMLGATSSLDELAKLSIGSKLFKGNLDAYYQLSVLSKFADMRGDARASESIAKLAAPFNVAGPVPDTVLKKINTAAQEYYSKLAEERRSLGLGAFDDSRLLLK